MPIVHIKKHENNFVQIDKRPLSDERLSWKAKGLWCYLMSKPPDWKVYVNELVQRSKDGEHAVRKAMQELIDCGYAKRKAIREKGKFKEWAFFVYEQPINQPDGDFPDVDFPDVENPPLNKNEENKNEDILSAPADNAPAPAFFAGVDAEKEPAEPNAKPNQGQVRGAAKVKAKKKTEYVRTMERLELAFAKARSDKIILPDWKNDPKAANRRWRTPLKRMWTKAGKDTAETERLVIQATQQLKVAQMTFDAPDQIEKTFGALLLDGGTKQPENQLAGAWG